MDHRVPDVIVAPEAAEGETWPPCRVAGEGQGWHRSSLRKPQRRRGSLRVSMRSAPARLPVPVALLITDGVMMARWEASVTTRGTKGA